jgi:predicted RNase H-like HicB family nuclease
MTAKRSLEEYLALDYSLDVIADPDGGYVLAYPDLPGCMTQVETIDEVPAAAKEIRELWIETQFEDGYPIPLPSYPDEYSGKFVLRIGKSLHRRLAESAKREGVSLNAYAAALLDRNDALARVEGSLERLDARLDAIDAHTGNGSDDYHALTRSPAHTS